MTSAGVHMVRSLIATGLMIIADDRQRALIQANPKGHPSSRYTSQHDYAHSYMVELRAAQLSAPRTTVVSLDGIIH